MTILVQQLRAEIEQLKTEIDQLGRSLKLVQSHAHTAYTRGRQAGIADQERTAREAIAAMDLARDRMMDENERFTDLLEKAEQERDQLKAENAELRRDAERYRYLRDGACTVATSQRKLILIEDMEAIPGDFANGGEMLDDAIDQAMTKEQP